jgi:hypothetical protein
VNGSKSRLRVIEIATTSGTICWLFRAERKRSFGMSGNQPGYQDLKGLPTRNARTWTRIGRRLRSIQAVVCVSSAILHLTDERLISFFIPASVEPVGNDSFCGCVNLAVVALDRGSRMTSIGEMAFAPCGNLQFIDLPPNLDGWWPMSQFRSCSLCRL